MPPPDPKEASAAQRRTARRRSSSAQIQVELPAASLDGEVDNLSSSGILFYTAHDLVITMEITEANGQKSTRTGRLVRMQRLQPGHNGWAVEFDATA
jgi:hypothetical protein